MSPRVKRIYRVEDYSGNGPFRPTTQQSALYPYEGKATRMPLPSTDSKLQAALYSRGLDLYYSPFLRFGFSAKRQVQRWFPKHDAATREIAEGGYGVATYLCACDKVYVGQSQVVFDVNAATRIDFQPFDRNYINED